jgi:hypothetical protein
VLDNFLGTGLIGRISYTGPAGGVNDRDVVLTFCPPVLSPSSVTEQLPVGTAVGTLSSSDPVTNGPYGFTLVDTATYPDNARFSISGSQLRTNAVFDYDTQSSYNIKVRSTDASGIWYKGVITVTVLDVNVAPTDLSLSATAVAEDLPAGTAVGTFGSVDPEPPAAPFTYTLVTGTGDTDNASFTIAGDQLQTNAAFDYETKSSYAIRVRTTDAGGLFFEKELTIV